MSKKVDIALGELLPKLKEVAYNINNDTNKADDAVSMVVESMLNMNRDTLQDIYDKGGLLWYAIRCITLNLGSKTSRYYYKYNKYYERVDTNVSNSTYSVHYYENNPDIYEDNDKEINLEAIDNLLQDLYWYDRDLFITYYKGGYTLDSLSDKTGISRMSIFNTIKKVKNFLKERVNEEADKIRESKELY
jgi:predicted DNA-binding protein YlxM (UPF0122 family)